MEKEVKGRCQRTSWKKMSEERGILQDVENFAERHKRAEEVVGGAAALGAGVGLYEHHKHKKEEEKHDHDHDKESQHHHHHKEDD